MSKPTSSAAGARAGLAVAALAALGAGTAAVADPSPQPPARAAIEEPTPAPPEAPPPPSALTRPPESAADVTGAPLPGDESGRLDVIDEGDSLGRRTARGALLLPRTVLKVVFAPIRGGLWLFERYQLDALFRQIFFNDANTIGLYPTADFQSGFGISFGARFVDRDVFGAREHLSLLAGFGGQFRQIVRLGFRTGDRFGDHFALGLDADYERRPGDPFYGIGNGDELTTAPAMPVDPRVDPTAIDTHYSQRRARVAAVADVRVVDGLHAIASGALVDHIYGPGQDGTPIDMVYDPAGLVGWNGVQHAYGELELRWDDRHPADAWEPRALLTAGSMVSGFAGRVTRLDAGADFWRYGVDLQHFLRVGDGPRVLIARLHGEGVTGSRDQVAFTELPALGGASLLRGYAYDRFRDRVAAVGTLEYQWDLSRLFEAGLFVDAGRVYDSLRDLGVDQLRVGYGVALEMHSERGFLVEGSVATSKDGGVFFNLALSPAFDPDSRVRRR